MSTNVRSWGLGVTVFHPTPAELHHGETSAVEVMVNRNLKASSVDVVRLDPMTAILHGNRLITAALGILDRQESDRREREARDASLRARGLRETIEHADGTREDHPRA